VLHEHRLPWSVLRPVQRMEARYLGHVAEDARPPTAATLRILPELVAEFMRLDDRQAGSPAHLE
jgi:hypothetical protein